MERDKIDLGTVKISRLFRKYFVPTLISMLNIAVATTVEGVFVGHKIGNDGIAAVNLVMPLMLLFTGIGMMIGIGCSVVASIHLAKGNVKAARINVTQGLLAGNVLVIVPSIIMLAFPHATASFLGASDTLMKITTDYLVWLMPGFLFNMWVDIGLFVVRLDGSPKVAMFSSFIAGVLCILAEWLFIYVFDWGIKGAAAGAVLSLMSGAFVIVGYILFKVRVLKLYRLKWSKKSMLLTLRNLDYQCRIGSTALLGEATVVVFMFVGNHVFMEYLGDNGVGAFGIACYYMPFVFMMGNAVAQSAQPILSYNYGAGNMQRVGDTFKISLKTAIACGLIASIAFVLFPYGLVALFVDMSNPASQMAIEGFPYMGIGFVFYIVNLAIIGFYQSIERLKPATLFALMRGFLILVPSFVLMPLIIGPKGMWLAMPISEIITFFFTLYFLSHDRKYAR